MHRHAFIFTAVASALIGASIAIGFAYCGNRGLVVRDVRDAEIIVYDWRSAHLRFWDDETMAYLHPPIIFAEWANGFGVISTSSQFGSGPPYAVLHVSAEDHESLRTALTKRIPEWPHYVFDIMQEGVAGRAMLVRGENSNRYIMTSRLTERLGWNPQRTDELSADDKSALTDEAARWRGNPELGGVADAWQECRSAIMEHVARSKAKTSLFGGVQIMGTLDDVR
jgi:hypothetical protein